MSLADLAQTLTRELVFCGIAVQRDGRAPSFHIAAPGRRVDAGTMFRVASVSKVITGRVAQAVLLDATRPAEDILGFPLRHPAMPRRPVTVGQIAAHHAGLTDAGGYILPEGVALADWFGAQGDAVWGARPGTRFAYCNLGYILLAAMAERVAGARFDDLARRLVLDPLGIAGGFNWSGVPPEARANRLPTFRLGPAGFAPQIDLDVAPEGIFRQMGEPALTGAYVLGRDATQLSPQGGFRTSLAGMIRLAASLPNDPERLWQGRQDDDPDRLFTGYGWGLQILDDPSFYPRPLVGHFASAYGFLGGVWRDPARGVSFAYGLNGRPMDEDGDEMTPAERAIFAALAAP